jgi:hypothetical protein
MLRVTVYQEPALCRLQIAGRLEGPWVAETEQVWRSSLCSAKQLEVDIRQLTGVDDCGRQLLSAMHREGARLVAEGVWIRSLVEEIASQQPRGSAAQQPSKAKTPRKLKF